MSSIAQCCLTDSHPGSARTTRATGWTDRVRRFYRHWRVRRADWITLELLTERDLLDIGRTRLEIHNELAKPFWRD